MDIGGLFMKFSWCIHLHKVLIVPLHTDTVLQWLYYVMRVMLSAHLSRYVHIVSVFVNDVNSHSNRLLL